MHSKIEQLLDCNDPYEEFAILAGIDLEIIKLPVEPYIEQNPTDNTWLVILRGNGYTMQDFQTFLGGNRDNPRIGNVLANFMNIADVLDISLEEYISYETSPDIRFPAYHYMRDRATMRQLFDLMGGEAWDEYKENVQHWGSSLMSFSEAWEMAQRLPDTPRTNAEWLEFFLALNKQDNAITEWQCKAWTELPIGEGA